jgi:hypothetical protein
MPSSWHPDALKAQAIAARTYANRYLKTHSSICANTNCQYFHSDLINGSSRSAWRKAVDDTENMILDKDVSAQYSSTTGGWVNGVGWDTDGGSWPNDSYERKAGSPWFYKAWFTQTYKKNSSTCGRSHPWLNGEEMADILNAYVLLKAGKEGHFRSRYIQVTGAHISYHSVPGAPAIDCVSFQDIVGVLYFDGHSREVQNYGRPNSSFSNSAEIIEDLEFDPFTDFLVLTSREGYFRGDVKILSCLVLEFVGIQWLNLC